MELTHLHRLHPLHKVTFINILFSFVSLSFAIINLARGESSSGLGATGPHIANETSDLAAGVGGVMSYHGYPASSSCVPGVSCLCEGPTSSSDDNSVVYSHISCFLNGAWTTSLDDIPPALSLILSCSDQVEQGDLSESSFGNVAGHLSRLVISNCPVGALSNNTFSNMESLQRVFLWNNGLDESHLPVIGGIPTNASVRVLGIDLPVLHEGAFGARTSNVSVLDLSYNNVGEIHNKSFSIFPSLRKLFINNNNITDMHADAFYGLNQLSELNMQFNPAPFSRGKCVFRNIPSLTKLDLSSTELEDTSYFQCAPLPNLKTLLVSGNNLAGLSSAVFGSMPDLRVVDLSHNVMTYLNSTALSGGLASLSHVNLSHNLLQDIPPPFLYSTPALVSVNISHNRVTVIREGTFSGLSLLETVDLSFNHLHTIEQFGFVQLDRVDLIDLRSNNFVIVPDDLVWPFDILPLHIKMRTLMEDNPFTCGCPEMLSIRTGEFADTYPQFLLPDNFTWICLAPPPVANERMMTIPRDSFWCPSEDELCQQGGCECYIRDIDRANIFFCHKRKFNDLPDIPPKTGIFDCTGCLVTEHTILKPGEFEANPRLETLVLRDIGVQEIKQGALSNFPSLNQLDLSDNALTNLANRSLEGLTGLVTIDLSHNQLVSIDNQSFESNFALSTIHIHSNNLETLESGVFNYSQDLNVVTLHDNPFICNCSLFWLKQWLQSNLDIVQQMYDVKCYVNSSIEMSPIIQVEDQDFGCYEPDVHTLTVQEYTALIVTSSITVLLLLGASVVFRHRQAIRVILYTRYGFHLIHDDDDDDVIDHDDRWAYDAYLAYSDDDVEFVLHDLLPMLEEDADGPRYHVCLRHRDFLPGACIATTIVSSLEGSRRSIMVLSRSFLQDEWNLLEFKTAHQRVLQDKANKTLILVFRERLDKDEMDEDMRYYVTANAFLTTDDRLFREKLLFEMPKHPLAALQGEA